MDRAVLETASDRYVIVEYLAEGGMGAIYLGKKLGVDGFEKEVVLKQLLPEFTREQKFIDLFLREARLSASLDHANIVRTVDLVNAGEDYFMVMEYVRGGDLRTLLRRARRRHKRFSPQAAVFIGHEILEALAYAHGKSRPDGRPLNLIHRDVSPSNILLSGAGEVKLTDFGIAKASTHRSVFYKVKGKVGYMSPEQARAEQVDCRSDLFSLAVVMWEVLVGERLFVGDLLSSAAMVYAQKVVAPSSKRSDVPADLDAVILKALSLDPRTRFQSAEEMQEALSRAASRHRLLAGASEMAAQLRQVCGEDPSAWLKLERLAVDESQSFSTQAPGTAVLTQGEASQVSPDPFDDSAPHPARPEPVAALQHKELTSVIALRGDDVELVESSAVPLTPLAPRKSEKVPLDFENESSHAATRVRTGAGGDLSIEDASAPKQRQRTASGAQTLVREGSAPIPARPGPTPSWEEPTRASGQKLTGDDPEPAPVPAREGGSRPRQRIPTATGSVRNVPARDLPRSGIREYGYGVRRGASSKRRVLPIVILLLAIGIAVGVAVAFSGPELDIVDPPLPPPTQTQTPR